MAKKIAVHLENITKSYLVRHEKPTFIEQLLQFKQSKEIFTSLDDLSLKLYQGEKIGFYGPNGAGKTTLLKIISGITVPDSGSVKTKGRVVSLIDLEAGFHPDLTGEENIFLNGLIVGMSKEEIRAKFKKIVDFADIGSFIDAPLYTYSFGMKLRLGFSVAAHSNPDILILDEVISAGDTNFQKKSNLMIDQFFKKKKTIIVVTHWLDYLEKNCSRIFKVDKGKIYEQ